MNRFIFKKSMALLLAVVMLFSSALVNIPVYADGAGHDAGSTGMYDSPFEDDGDWDQPPVEEIHITEGEDKVPEWLMPIVPIGVTCGDDGCDHPDHPEIIQPQHVFILENSFKLSGASDEKIQLDQRPFQWHELFRTDLLKPIGNPYYVVVTGPFDMSKEKKAAVLRRIVLYIDPEIMAVDDDAEVVEGNHVDIDILENDMLPIGLYEIIVSQTEVDNNLGTDVGPSHGTIDFVYDESYTFNTKMTYTANVGFIGDDVFEYKVKASDFDLDPDNNWYIATVTVTVTPDSEFTWTISGPEIQAEFRDDGPNVPGDDEIVEGDIEADFDEGLFPTVLFDFGSAVITSLTPEITSNGVASFDGMVVTYDPITKTNLDLEVVMEDEFGRIATGLIPVFVFRDSSYARVDLEEPFELNLDQYDGLNPFGMQLEAQGILDMENAVREGVFYDPSDGATIVEKYEMVTQLPTPGFYDFNMKNGQGNPISTIYYYGDFELEYWMLDSEGQGDSAGYKTVHINAQPKISLADDIDPEYVWLPEGAVSVANGCDIEPLVIDYKEEPFNILGYLYGYDFEDYPRNDESTLEDDEEALLEDGLQFMFYMDGPIVGYDYRDFWDKVVLALPETQNIYEDEGGFYSLYHLKFTLTDIDGFESPKTCPLPIKVYNTPPEFVNPIDDFQVFGEDDGFDIMAGIEVTDNEDEFFANNGGPRVMPLTDNRGEEAFEVIIDRLSATEPPTRISLDDFINDDHNENPGIYEIEYRYTDLHGEFIFAATEVWIVENPYIDVDEPYYEIELGGYFPTFMGVTASFWNSYEQYMPNGVSSNAPNEFTPLPALPDQGDIREWVEARIVVPAMGDDPEYEITIAKWGVTDFNEMNYGLLYRFVENNPSLEIKYYAIQEIYDGEDTPFTNENHRSRMMTVTDEDFEEYFMTSDIGDAHMLVGEPYYSDEVDFRGIQLPLVYKMKTVDMTTDDISMDLDTRIFTTIVDDEGMYNVFDSSTSLEVNRMGYYPHVFLDLAETHDYVEKPGMLIPMDTNGGIEPEMVGNVYGISINQNIWKFNWETGMFDYVTGLAETLFSHSLREEIAEYLNDHAQDFILTPSAVETGDLFVMPVLSLTADKDGDLVFVVSVYVEEIGYDYFYNILVTLDPDTLDYTLDIVQSEEGYPLINDLAFADNMEDLYAIGSRLDNSQVRSMSIESVAEDAVSLEGISPYYIQDAIQFVKIEEGNVGVDSLLDINLFDYRIQYLGTLDEPLDGAYHFTGLAVMSDQMIFTKLDIGSLFQSRLLVPVHLLNTFVEIRTIGGEVLDEIEIQGLFNWGFGAADKYERELSLVASANQIQAGETVNLTLTAMPEAVYGVGAWVEDGLGALGPIDISAYGIETATYTSVAGTPGTNTDVTFTVTTLEGTVSEVVNVVTPPAQIIPDDDDEPRTRRTTTTIRVTLDTDAVTLDYGETADPEFTSYDFTETVTGTTNRDVTWELSDDTYVTVDENGVVTAKDDVPTDTGDFTVTLTVRTVVGNATDTATILFEEQTPLGAIEFFDPYIAGYPDNSFRPTNYVTRAEVASMFAKILKLNITTSGSQKFMDVPETHWAYGQVQAMYRSGVFAGYMDVDGSRYFDPEAPISRAEIAQVFTNYWRFLDISVNGGTVTSVPDVDANLWAAPAINRIFNTGIFTGFEDGTFRPNEATLREQIVSMINRLIDRPANQAAASKFNDILPTHNHFGDIEAASQTFLKPQPE